MAALAGDLGPAGVGDLDQVLDHLAQPGRIQAPGRLEQDRFGVGGEVVGELAGAVDQDPSMGG